MCLVSCAAAWSLTLSLIPLPMTFRTWFVVRTNCLANAFCFSDLKRRSDVSRDWPAWSWTLYSRALLNALGIRTPSLILLRSRAQLHRMHRRMEKLARRGAQKFVRLSGLCRGRFATSIWLQATRRRFGPLCTYGTLWLFDATSLHYTAGAEYSYVTSAAAAELTWN